MADLQSSLKSQGEYVTQIIHFVGGVKRTFENIKTAEIKQGQMTKLETLVLMKVYHHNCWMLLNNTDLALAVQRQWRSLT